jgi:hypothetical protein
LADTKVSALPAATAVDAADEFPINDAGISKKATAEQIRSFLTGALNTFSLSQRVNSRIGIGVDPDVATVAKLKITGGGADNNIYSFRTIPNGSGISGTYTIHDQQVSITETELVAPGTQLRGIRSGCTYGNSGAPSTGTFTNFISDLTIAGQGDADSEYANWASTMRFDIGTGFAQTAGPTGRAWMQDLKLFGPINVQPDLLMGTTILVNNFYNGSPVEDFSLGLQVVSRPAQGNTPTAHDTSPTYPVDVGIVVAGSAGPTSSPTTRQGFTTGIRVGGPGAGWNIPTSRLGTGLEIRDYETFGVHINNRFTGATGPALAVAAGNGPVLIGATAASDPASMLEVHKAGQTSPLVLFQANAATDFLSLIMRRQSSGTDLTLFVAGAANHFLTGTAQGDVGVRIGTATGTFHVGRSGGAGALRVGASVVVGSAALATSAIDGFLYIPTCAGPPTGTPTTQNSTVPIVFDTTNNRIYVYDGSWMGVQVAV